ncbi:HlyD family secretion protein [Flavobacterium yafengii]|jgi:membrane fusion protein (multidrug efflux system)|uniref:HlyD family secretion protein n=1 Tax=Flavobacterium yafengii TaxID=3041253 RepID=UPI0024A9F574|nr:HlyD family secretion protein [Flavobacterium yafengii]MDI5887683.1 HlyD family secretion protein [Flavobacterium yafengii]
MSTTNSEKRKLNKKLSTIIVNSLLIICVISGIVWGISTYFELDNELYTNDAQIEEYINPVNTRIPGYIKEVRFKEHQHIKKGDTLVLIDDSEYKIQREQAEATYLSAAAAKNVTASTVNTVKSNLSVLDATIKAAEARMWNAKQNYLRYDNLLSEGAATQQQFDQVKSEYNSLASQTKALIQQKQTALLSTEETFNRSYINDAEIKRANAALAMAKLNQSYTVITAPYDGVTGRRTIQEGQLVQGGQTLLSLVRNDSKWVVANYKETHITKLHIGQKMKLKVDGLKQKELLGRITAISQATGSKYSAVPIDNSTGNFIKVQQRIPVKIEFITNQNAKIEIAQLKAGMNVEVRIAH